MIKPGTATILSPTARLVGELSTEDEIVLSGSFEGTLRTTRNVQVATTGRMLGEIHAESVLILGQVQGPVTAIDRIELQGGAVVNGDLSAQRVRIHDDVIFNGNCRITGPEAARKQYLVPALVQVFGTPAPSNVLSRVETAAENLLQEFGFDVELRPERPSDGSQTLRPIFRSREALPYARLRERLRSVEQALQTAASPDAPRERRFGTFLNKKGEKDGEAPLQATGTDGARALLDALSQLRNGAVLMGPVVVTRFEAEQGPRVAVRSRPDSMAFEGPNATPDPSALLVALQKAQTEIVRDLTSPQDERAAG